MGVRLVVVPLLVTAVVAVALVGRPATAAAVPLIGAPPPPRAGGAGSLVEVAASGAVRPVPGRVVRSFEPPDGPYGAGHRGVDLAAAPGDPVRAALAGQATFAGAVAGTGWVTLVHPGGLQTTYGDVAATVQPGEWVPAGAVIGHLAEPGTHLDWGARLDGDYLDPMSLLRPWRAHLVALTDVPTGEVVVVPP